MKKLREDEEIVIKAVAVVYRGEWRIGENPPDAYLKIGDEEIAVEISTLSQQIPDGKGGLRPRLSDDAAASRLLNELNEELSNRIPEGRIAILMLSSPILEYKKVKNYLVEKIIYLVSNVSHDVESQENICNNQITIKIAPYGGGKKVVGTVSNRESNPDILLNSRCILEKRITVKAKKCQSLPFKGNIWLALLNDYWLADTDTYKQALESFSIKHPFQKILLISGSRVVSALYEE